MIDVGYWIALAGVALVLIGAATRPGLARGLCYGLALTFLVAGLVLLGIGAAR